MKKEEIIKKTKKFVKSKLYKEGSGHDWWHTLRVCRLAKKIGKKEGGDLFIIEMAALLHDISDWKFQDDHDKSAGANIAKKWLEKFNLESKTISRIFKIIKEISFKGTGVKNKLKTLEGKVVQDTDRLDAIGAIGIARCFTYGGSIGRQIHNPNKKPFSEKYSKTGSSSVNHFYEKLLLLKDRMNTETGKVIAEKRHQFMKDYLEEFLEEWRGK